MSHTPAAHVMQTAPAEHEFRLTVDGRTVPVALWSPPLVPGAPVSRRPLVLVGHGGTGHKRSTLVLDAVERFRPHGVHVAAIDGPVHGSRREVFDEGDAVRAEFRELWARGGSIDPMVADWRATIDHLCGLPAIDPRAVGWYGISMGTAYGMPLVAAEPRIRAGVLGMWGTSRAGSERLVSDGALIHCPVLFQLKENDELFSVAGQVELFDSIASSRKHFKIYPGTHVNPSEEQLDDIVEFLLDELGARS